MPPLPGLPRGAAADRVALPRRGRGRNAPRRGVGVRRLPLLLVAAAATLAAALLVARPFLRREPPAQRAAPADRPAPSGRRYGRPYASPRAELLTILGVDYGRSGDRPISGRFRPARKSGGGGNEAAAGGGGNGAAARTAGLRTLPYLQGYKAASGRAGVTRHDPARAQDGVNLYTSGHAPAAMLVDMGGRLLHRWQVRLQEVWPAAPRTVHAEFLRRVVPLADGDLLVLFEGYGLVMLDRASRVRWANRDGHHHQAVVGADGRIYALQRRAQVLRRVHPTALSLADQIAILGRDGEPLGELSILEGLENSRYSDLLQSLPEGGDLMHANAIQVLDGSQAALFPPFARGNILFSLMGLDTLAVLDPGLREVVWAATPRKLEGAGEPPGARTWQSQHDPTVLANGNLLIFDNAGQAGRSKVLEYDPRSGAVVWRYAGTADDPLDSATCGTAQRLDNGNTLITESDNGRALEVTPGGEVVWEFYNPARAGAQKELIATLFAVQRLPRSFFPWLGGAGSR